MYIGSSGPMRAEPNTLIAVADLGQRVEPLYQLGQDAERPPRIGVQERGVALLENLLVLGGALVAVHHRAAAMPRGRDAIAPLLVHRIAVCPGRNGRFHAKLGM